MIKLRKISGKQQIIRYIKKMAISARYMTLDQWIITGLIIMLPGTSIIANLLMMTGIGAMQDIGLKDMIFEGTMAVFICAAAGFALFHPKRRAKMMKHPAFFVTMALLPLMVIPAVLSGNKIGIILGGVMWALLTVGVYASSIMNRRFYASILDLLLALSVIASIWGVIDYYVNEPMVFDEVRTASFFYNANHYGYAIELFSIIALCRFVRRTRPIYLMVFGINLASIMLCGCRAAWGAVFVSAAVLIVFKLRGKQLLLGITVAALLSTLMLVIVLPEISQRFTGEVIYRAFERRLAMFSNAIRWIKESPVTGYGMGSYYMLSVREGVTHSGKYLFHAHNLFLGLTLDFGLLGFAAFILYIWQMVVSAFSREFIGRYSYVSAISLTLIIATAVHGMIDFPVSSCFTGLLIVIILSGSSIMRNDSARAEVISDPAGVVENSMK